MINESLFTSKTDMWATPQEFFNKLNEEFQFDIDVCATKENAKCENFFSVEDDGLNQDWNKYKSIWCNPPYGKNIAKWIEKAYNTKSLVVMLLPARTDTRYFHKFIYNKTEIRFIKGRLKFGDSKNSAPFPSMVVIFNR